MAVKTFASGEVLTASDTNTYLGNGGLVYVASQAVGTAVSTVTVSGAFSSTYDNYRIIYSGGTGSTTHNLRLQLGSAVTSYYGFAIYGAYTGTTVAGINDNNATLFRYVGGGDTSGSSLSVEVRQPFASTATYISADLNTGTNFGYYSGRYFPTTSFTAFTISPDGGTLTGGTITVYGYRKA